MGEEKKEMKLPELSVQVVELFSKVMYCQVS